MSFDFSQVLQDAQNTLNNGNDGGGYKYKLVYPNVGTLTVKLLFNAKSNTVKRIINRHTIGDEKIACLRTYGQECPICKMLDSIANAKGIDMYKNKSIARGISIVEYVDSTYKIEGVNKGDIVLLMYPWTVYKDLSSIIAQAKTPADIQRLMASNEGFTVNITRGSDNKYSTQLGAFTLHKSKATDEEFMAMLEGLDNLNDMILPATPTDEILKDATEVAQELQQQYLANNTAQNQFYQQPGTQSAVPMSAYGQQPQQAFQQTQQPAYQPQPQPQYQPQPQPQSQAPAPQSQGVPAGMPPCFGTHGHDPNKCLMCPNEVVCVQAK